LLLRQLERIAPLLDFPANDIGPFIFSRHARKYELDSSGAADLDCYAFVAKQIAAKRFAKLKTELIPMFLRRLGPDPHANGATTVALNGCPDIFELESGDFAIIGVDITEISLKQLPASANCGSDERIVWIPRKTLVLAKADIPSAV